MVDPHRGVHGGVHAPARHHDRERRPAGHPARPRRVAVGPAVGDRRVRPDPRGAPAHRRLARGPLRPQAAVRDRHAGVHRRVVPVRHRPDRAVPVAGPGGAGRRGSGHVRDRAGAAVRCVLRTGARHGVRVLRGHHGCRRRGRTGARRRTDQLPVVELDLLRQHPDLRARARRDAHQGRGEPGPAPGAARPGRLPHLQLRARAAGARADPRWCRRLGGQPGRGQLRRQRRCCWWPSWSARWSRSRRCSTWGCSASRPSSAV